MGRGTADQAFSVPALLPGRTGVRFNAAIAAPKPHSLSSSPCFPSADQHAERCPQHRFAQFYGFCVAQLRTAAPLIPGTPLRDTPPPAVSGFLKPQIVQTLHVLGLLFTSGLRVKCNFKSGRKPSPAVTNAEIEPLSGELPPFTYRKRFAASLWSVRSARQHSGALGPS